MKSISLLRRSTLFLNIARVEIDFHSLRFFTKIGQPSSSNPMIGTHRNLDATRRSRLNSTASGWLLECVEKRHCQGTHANLPTRVLDLSKASNDSISLYVSEHKIETYAALSHAGVGRCK